MSRETTGAGGFTARGTGFRLWAGIVFVVVVAGLLAYVLPSPAQWRQSISTFVANLPGFKEEPTQAPAQDDNVVWMAIGPETPVEQASRPPVTLTLSGVPGIYSLSESIELLVRNNEAGAATWIACKVEQRTSDGWRAVPARHDGAPSTCTSNLSPIPGGQTLSIAWSPQPTLAPGQYRFSVRAHRERDAAPQSATELHSRPFVLR
jgi:hypothetical protein